MKNSDSLSFTIAVMKYTGVWLPENLSYRGKMAFMGFRCLTQGVMFFLIILAEIGYVLKNRNETERVVDAAVLLLSHLVQAVKVMTIMLRQERIKRLIVFGDGPAFIPTEPNLKTSLERAVKLTDLVGTSVMLSAGVTAVFWLVMPVLKDELTLPLMTAYPFDINGTYMYKLSTPRNYAYSAGPLVDLWKRSLYAPNGNGRQNKLFAVMYAYSSLSLMVSGVADAAENFLVSGVLTLASTQVGLLNELLLDLKAGGKDGCYEKSVRCVKFHQQIIEYVDEIANIFGLPIFCQCVTSSIVVCMTVYKITTTQAPLELVTMIFYLICVFMELLMYCYPADMLLNTSLQVADVAYPDWSGDTKTAKVLLLTALRAQRPLTIDAGGMFRISLPTATAVVQTSYTYYALLQQTLK